MTEELEMSDDEILQRAEQIKKERENPDDRGLEIWVVNDNPKKKIDQVIALPGGQIVTVRWSTLPVELGLLAEQPEKVIRSSAYKQAIVQAKVREVTKEYAQEEWAKPGARKEFMDKYLSHDKTHPSSEEENMPELLYQQIRVLQDESLAGQASMEGMFDGDENHAIEVLHTLEREKRLRSSIILAAGEGAEEREWHRLESAVSAIATARMVSSVETHESGQDGFDENDSDLVVTHVEPAAAKHTGRVKPDGRPKVLDENNQAVDVTPTNVKVRGEEPVTNVMDVMNKQQDPGHVNEAGQSLKKAPPAVGT